MPCPPQIGLPPSVTFIPFRARCDWSWRTQSRSGTTGTGMRVNIHHSTTFICFHWREWLWIRDRPERLSLSPSPDG
jgi:hypothetical protein